MPDQYSRTRLLLGREGFDRLRQARVAVFGLGGVGGYTAEALARSGIGQLDLIDDDTISQTNLNRQMLALHSTIGMYKVDVAEARIRDIDPTIRVTTYKTFYLPETADQFDFSKYGDAFTDSIRMTLTNLLNETFVTLFADNRAYISAVTKGNFDAPLTYSLDLADSIENADKCIFIIEDSQLDIGLLVAVERNVNRIFQIISDYLSWNDEMIAESMHTKSISADEKGFESFDVYAEDCEPEKKKSIFGRIGDWFKKVFKKKIKKGENDVQDADSNSDDGLTPKQRRKTEKIAKKAAKKAEREEKKKLKQEEKLRKQQQKEHQKETEPAKDEKFIKENIDAELTADESLEEVNLENEEEVSEDE